MDGESLEGTDPGTRRYDCRDYEAGEGADHVTGISAGWADVYTHELADQYIEVSGIEDGFYLLLTRLDPLKTLWERSRKDNTTSTLIEICGTDVEIVGGHRDACPG
jgi:hypothetical protein